LLAAFEFKGITVPTSSHTARPLIETLPPQRVLAVDDLTVAFRRGGSTFNAVRNLSLTVERGETLAIVGESGSGKSVTSLALMRLIEHGGGRVAGGGIAFRRRDGSVLDLAQASSRSVIRSARRSRCIRARAATPRAQKPCGCSNSCGFPRRNGWPRASRINCRAACVSA
jgi:glutathione transport system ATP-binding protein